MRNEGWRMLAEIQRRGPFILSRLNKGTYGLSRVMHGRLHTLVLKETMDGYRLEPISYLFRSSNSYINYTEDETRWTRNKAVILTMLQLLSKTSLWEKIENKDEYFTIKELKRGQTKGYLELSRRVAELGIVEKKSAMKVRENGQRA